MGEQKAQKSGPETGVNRSGWTSRAVSPGVERRSATLRGSGAGESPSLWIRRGSGERLTKRSQGLMRPHRPAGPPSSFLPLAARPLLPSMLLPFPSLQQGSGSRQFVCAIGSECPGQGSNWVFLDVSAATKETGHYGPSEFLTLVELMSE